ncbi:MAG: OmpH family outer membrane protein [Lentisphaerae bacterium]|nr:OmpH family outer membrane protein [Lentisphaerota bacterium]MBQ4329780.1 OmpH family outer membrane protein [Lentisphaeria bacterium]
MKKILLALLIGVSAVLSAAELRIAVVDLDRVFKSYYKSRIAEDFLNQQAEAARTYMSQLNSQLESLRAEARRLGTNALNPALNDQARKKAADDADAALAKVKSKETEISLYANERRREFMRLQQEKRDAIVKDIRQEIKRRAAAGNYAFVLDSSGKTTSGLPAVVVFPAKHDISDEVIRELNRTASKPNGGN